MRSTVALVTAGITLVGLAACSGAGSSSEAEPTVASAAPRSTPTEEAGALVEAPTAPPAAPVSGSENLVVGEIVGTNAGSIGEYRLLWAETPGIACADDPLSAWNEFQAGSGDSARVIYTDATGIGYLSTLSSCSSAVVATTEGEQHPGIIEALVGVNEADMIDPDPVCASSGLVVNCSRHLGNGVYASVKAAQSIELDGQKVFLASFLTAYIGANLIIPQYAA